MPTFTIDDRKVEFKPGDNVVDAAARGGVEVPVFCYHKGLTVVAQCRMCAVEVEGVKKIQTACSTKATDGMVVKTKTPAVLKARESVMEFLLINHPLDCPICDKSGECDLQDNSFGHGNAYMRYTEERRTYLDLDMGPVIQKNMNRCIHCTRCIRFGDEIAGIREMVAISRGNNTEITTIGGKPLETDYAGNYADICPTGSLTLKDFRYKKRAWMLTKTPTVCEGCSRGCNMEIHHDRGQMHRSLPRENQEINKYWLCDEGRFNFRRSQSADRLVQPVVEAKQTDWFSAVSKARSLIAGKSPMVLVGTDLTNEELELVQNFAKTELKGAQVRHFGTPGIATTKDDGDADKILKKKSKTANLNGAEKLGIAPFKDFEGADTVFVIAGGRAVTPSLAGKKVVAAGVFDAAETQSFSVVLPGLSFAEKDGTYFNFSDTRQQIRRAGVPDGECKALSEIFMIWAHSGAGSKGVA